jgi:hypothetical protein
MLWLLIALQHWSADTLFIRAVDHLPSTAASIDRAALGQPQLRMRTGQGVASVWVLRARDTVFVAARIPDSTSYWGDDFVISLDTRGDGSPTPQHDDFQLYFRRILDSSVVFRGRNGRWEPPRNDPDWRLGASRSGGGWEVSGRTDGLGWSLTVRLDPAWFAGEAEHLPRIAFRIYDDSPSGWFTWPRSSGLAQPSWLEQTPRLWAPVR